MQNSLLHIPPCILTVEQTRQCEQYTMAHEPISSLDLMERAGATCGAWIANFVREHDIMNIKVLCGSGNNGGDGLVIARLLAKHTFLKKPTVEVVLCERDHPKRTSEMETNLARWQQVVQDNPAAKLSEFKEGMALELSQDTLVVDALFGIGLSRPVEGVCADAIRAVNASDAQVVAIDTPSGLFADVHTPVDATVMMANVTLSIQYPKLAYFLPQAYPFCGEVEVMDIEMYPPQELEWKREYLTKESMAGFLRMLPPYAHKGTFGHGLLIAGSADMPGAAILAATAAMRGGVGKVTVHTAGLAAQHIPARLPEAILHRDADDHHVTELRWDSLQKDINALAIGPGIGTHRQTVTLLKNLLDEVHAPLILDADALNILAENKTWLAYLPPYSILTPHFKEFERLAGPFTDDFDRVEKARQFAQKYEIILVLKGCHSVVSLPDGKQFVNTTGNPGMATAGSGDVLTGLLLSLLAQGYNPVETALLGMFVHGLAGDLYAQTHDPRTLIASDLPNHFSAAYHQLNLLEESHS